MYKVFIIEDDRTLASLLEERLAHWGFEARRAVDFSNIPEEFFSFAPHIALVDVSLPYYNGYYWCSEIRRSSRVPIIFISSHSEDMDIVMAVNMGADDYITKPFSPDVLIAKINALLRRAYSYGDEAPPLEAFGAELRQDSTLFYNGEAIELTKNEFRILKTLFESKNRVVSRSDIMTALWDSESFIDDNTLTVNVNRLRKKLASSGLEGLIETKKGEGYLVHDK